MKIVFLDEYSVNGADVSALKALGDYTGYYNTEPDETAGRCRDAEVVITNKTKMTREIMALCPTLKLICIAATGMNNVDLDAAMEMGIEVRNAIGYSTDSVAEATFAFALALLRHLVANDQYVKSGEYTRSQTLFHFGAPIRELHGKRWGIIGMGHIGRRVAEIAGAFGATAAYYSTSGQNHDAGYPQLPLDELLGTSDVVSIHAPLSRVTYNLIDYPQIVRMKESAILINVARGKIVNEAGLARALNENRIAGAGLDVFASEPMEPGNPLLSIDNPDKLVLAPHMAWASVEALQALVDTVARNIRDFYQIK